MGKEVKFDYDFDNIGEIEQEYSPLIRMYDEDENMIQGVYVSHLINISIDYKNKVFHAEYQADEETRGFKNGHIFDIQFYKLVIV